MITFKQFISEEKNSHMTHLADMVWDGGVDGVRKAINYIQTLRDQLGGHAIKPMNVSVKWDGAPSVFAGIDPSDGKFFVAKKGIFNKNPKVYKTHADIDADASGDLNVKLKIALDEFPKLGIKGVIQGDFLYAKSDLREVVIDGESYVTFHPNTIVYAVPKNSKLAQRILSSEVGVVWHTQYSGRDFESMHASFGNEIAKHLKKVNTVWAIDAVFKDVSGQANMTAEETKEVTKILSDVGKAFNRVTKETFDLIADDDTLNIRVNAFVNSKVRQGSLIDNPASFGVELKQHIDQIYSNEAAKRKTEKAQQGVFQKASDLKNKIDQISAVELASMAELHTLLTKASLLIIDKLDRASKMKTFLATNDGFEVTAPEGYVSIDHLGKGALKLVDRLQFSKANFSSAYKKGWQR